MKAGRKQPYTATGIQRLACVRCGAKAQFQWNVCADGNVFRPICTPCDIALNELVLKWIGDPHWKAKIAAYRQQKECKA